MPCPTSVRVDVEKAVEACYTFRPNAAPCRQRHAPPALPPMSISRQFRGAGSLEEPEQAAQSSAAPAFVPHLARAAPQAVEVMMAAAVERGGVRAAFLNPSSGGGGGPAPSSLPTGALAGAVVLGSGSGSVPVPMNLFATWEIDRSSPSCVPR